MIKINFTRTIILLMTINTVMVSYPPACDNDIYCKGEILHTVQSSFLYDDSKTFVDMKMKIKPDAIKKKFKIMMDKTDRNPTQSQVRKFVDECFDHPESEYERFSPTDWKPNPAFLNTVDDKRLKEWGKHLNRLWKKLGRKMKTHVQEHKDLYSILYVPNAMVVPGGRFREFYYWHSYWIILGLLHCEMKETAKGMLENFIQIIKEYGFIPNGGRIYYLKRSQPPLMIPMVKLYYEFTKDKAFIQQNLDVLVKEFEFWMNNRCVNIEVKGKTVKLAHYNVKIGGPRPESYREDLRYARPFKTAKEKDEFYSELKSACESGWDFSSRWYVSDGTHEENITDTKTRSIIPVDLNAILCWNAQILEAFFKMIGNLNEAKKYGNIADQWQESIQTLLWSEEENFWFDYDIFFKEQRTYYYASSLTPLWTGCFNKTDNESLSTHVMNYLGGVAQFHYYDGGLPTSSFESGEQWDFPNAWSPMQYIAIEGLENLGTIKTQQTAYDMAFVWVRSNFKGFLTAKGMFEKYDAQQVGAYGVGGEYEVQLGYGWTNGVILHLLHKYGLKLDATGISGSNIQFNTIVSKILIVMLLHIL